MLKPHGDINIGTDLGLAQGDSESFNIAQYWNPIRRQWPLVLTIMGVVIGLAVLYLLTATPKYTGTALVLIDSRTNPLFEKQQIVADAPLDASLADSQVEVLKSESVLLAVIRSMKLTQDPEFNGGDANFIQIAIGYVMSLFDSDGPASESKLERDAIEVMNKNLTVKRVGLTYVIELDYVSKGAAKSAEIANAIAESYMAAELDAKYQVTRKASKWLQDRIKELRSQATNADEAVRDFKALNNLVDTSRGLMSQQQLTDVNTQLIQAQAATAEAKARLERITEVNKGNLPDASMTDALKSDVISRLRAQYLDLSAKEADWSNRYGVNHIAAVNLRNQMAEIRHSISDELRRIAEAYSSDYKIAVARETSIQGNLNKLLNANSGEGKAQSQLRDLESTAQSYRSIYDNFLQQSAEAVQQQTFPTSGARLITAATTPLKKSSPKTLLVLLGSVVMGAFIGAGTALARERMDNAFRTPVQLEDLTGLECLGILPAISTAARNPGLPGPGNQLARELGIYRYVGDAPFSRFTETLRAVKVAATISGMGHETRVIGITSSVPHEGKTVVATNFAALLAQSGSKTLLIDSDMRRPSLTHNLANNTQQGLIAAIQNPGKIAEFLWHDPVSGFDFLPMETGQTISDTSEILSSTGMARLLTTMRDQYRYIVLDLPPIMPVVDVKAISHLVDKFVIVVEWGKTTQSVVIEALDNIEMVRDRLLGAILNKANPAALKRLETYRGRNYSSYYYDKESA